MNERKKATKSEQRKNSIYSNEKLDSMTSTYFVDVFLSNVPRRRRWHTKKNVFIAINLYRASVIKLHFSYCRKRLISYSIIFFVPHYPNQKCIWAPIEKEKSERQTQIKKKQIYKDNSHVSKRNESGDKVAKMSSHMTNAQNCGAFIAIHARFVVFFFFCELKLRQI